MGSFSGYPLLLVTLSGDRFPGNPGISWKSLLLGLHFIMFNQILSRKRPSFRAYFLFVIFKIYFCFLFVTICCYKRMIYY